MLPAMLMRRQLVSWRQPARAARLAAALWIALAIVVWNDVFDQVIITSARHYLYAAFASAHTGGPYLRIIDAMAPAVARARWLATAAAAPILAFGLGGVWIATRRPQPLERRT